MPRLLPPTLRLAPLLAAVAACFGALVSVAVGAPLAGRECVNDFPRRALCKFVDDLRDAIPEQIDASTGAPIRIGAYQIRQASPPLRPLLPIPAPAFIYSRPLTCIRSANPPKLHRDLPPTKLYAYGRSAATAHYPGPTLVAKRGVPSQVYWENHLTDRHHMFPVDYSIDDVARPLLGGIPIVTHRHGGENPSFADGTPRRGSCSTARWGAPSARGCTATRTTSCPPRCGTTTTPSASHTSTSLPASPTSSSSPTCSASRGPSPGCPGGSLKCRWPWRTGASSPTGPLTARGRAWCRECTRTGCRSTSVTPSSSPA
ncbi:unnamed protein product, partial [Closterium sp. Naga37s-1]